MRGHNFGVTIGISQSPFSDAADAKLQREREKSTMANDWGSFSKLLGLLESTMATLAEERLQLRRRSSEAVKSVLWNVLFIVGFDLFATVVDQHLPAADYPCRWLMVVVYVLLVAAMLLVFQLGKLETRRLKRESAVVRAKTLTLRAHAVEFAGDLQAEVTRLGESPPSDVEFGVESLLSSIEVPAEGEVESSERRIWYIVALGIAVVVGSACFDLLGR